MGSGSPSLRSAGYGVPAEYPQYQQYDEYAYPDEPVVNQQMGRPGVSFMSQSYQEPQTPSFNYSGEKRQNYYDSSPGMSNDIFSSPMPESDIYDNPILNQSMRLMKIAAMMNNSKRVDQRMSYAGRPDVYDRWEMMNQPPAYPDEQFVDYEAIPYPMDIQDPSYYRLTKHPSFGQDDFMYSQMNNVKMHQQQYGRNFTGQFEPRSMTMNQNRKQFEANQGFGNGQPLNMNENQELPASSPKHRGTDVSQEVTEQSNQNSIEPSSKQDIKYVDINKSQESEEKIEKADRSSEVQNDQTDVKDETQEELSELNNVSRKHDNSFDEIQIQTKMLTFEELLAQNLEKEALKNEESIFGKQIKVQYESEPSKSQS